jgi:prophage antirepressor-like protein
MPEQNRTTDLALFHFEGHRVRTYIDDASMTWWIAQDVCESLYIKQPSAALRRLDADEKTIILNHTPGGWQEMCAVNEPGLYTLILGSRKPEARAFKRWVTHDALPTLRRSGAYTLPGAVPPPPSNHLPPRNRPVQEMAHVSEMLLAVWTTLRQAEDPITNTEIAGKTRVPLRTVQRHTKYLLQLGLIDLYETRPNHLFMIAEQADKRHAGYFQRLERIAQIMEQRQRRLFT